MILSKTYKFQVKTKGKLKKHHRILIKICATDEKSCILTGHDIWFQWKPLLSDIFGFYEYFYEDGDGNLKLDILTH